MEPGKPSRTAIAAAASRAGHLHLYSGTPIFADDFAMRLVGIADLARLREVLETSGRRNPARGCAYFALRHRFAEDRLRMAVDRGVRQVVILGAGLDSLALRRPDFLDGITVVEVDHPDSQRWKRARIAALGLTPRDVTYVPVDFAHDDLGERLAASGVRLDAPIFFSWLGVTQYIDRAANDATFRFVAARPRESEVVFDFIVEDRLLSPADRAISAGSAGRSAARGEHWVSYFDPEEVERHLVSAGFRTVERLTASRAAGEYYLGQESGVTPLEPCQLIAAVV